MNRVAYNKHRRERRAAKEKRLSIRTEWRTKFLEKIKSVHRRNLENVVDNILRRIDSVKNQMVTRSRKAGVECTVTIEQLRQLLYDNYGMPCRYCNRLLILKNSTFDHIMPISKRGASNIGNLQVICRPCNHMKGSLDEASFSLLLNWLKTVPENLRIDITIRLARGIH